MANPINDAKDLDMLGKAVIDLAPRSPETYPTASVSVWKMLAGDAKWDAKQLTKSATKIWGQAAADATNAGLMVQKLANLAADGGGGSA